jgi:hypothetical protein
VIEMVFGSLGRFDAWNVKWQSSIGNSLEKHPGTDVSLISKMFASARLFRRAYFHQKQPALKDQHIFYTKTGYVGLGPPGILEGGRRLNLA